MSKPTSTAHNVDDNFSDSNSHSSYDDAAGQEQVTPQSSVTSASATWPSHPAAVDTADHGEEALSFEQAITVCVYPSRLDPEDADVKQSDPATATATVTLVSQGSDALYVGTYQNNSMMSIFGGSAPYRADTGNGTSYTLDPSFHGPITLVVATTSDQLKNSISGRAIGYGTINIISSSDVISNAPTAITVKVSPPCTDPARQDVAAVVGTVTLVSQGSEALYVGTYQNKTLTNVFEGSDPAPYLADTENGTSYTLAQGINGLITLVVATTSDSFQTTISDHVPPLGHVLPMVMNGTINVGG